MKPDKNYKMSKSLKMFLQVFPFPHPRGRRIIKKAYIRAEMMYDEIKRMRSSDSFPETA